MYKIKFFRQIAERFFNTEDTSPEHYVALKRNIVFIMLVITILPLTTMIVINHIQYRAHLRNEITAPMLSLANKTKHSFELFLKERLSTVRFIASAYTFEELSQGKNINRIFTVMKKEFGGFVDLGLINSDGELVSYAGPYYLLGKNYSKQVSFQETLIKGKYISDVFMGHRKYPHIVIAVEHLSEDGSTWILRATIDTDQFNNLISSMGLDPLSDAFLINTKGVLQTDSKYYGNVLDKCPINIPTGKFGLNLFSSKDPSNNEILIASAGFTSANYILVIVRPRSVILKSWYTLKTELFIVFAISIVLIVFAVLKITGSMVRRLKESDENREDALAELQHSQKLSSIGRLAAGVAHEINNPLAIINEKAGLMNDLILYSDDFQNKVKFSELTHSVLKSVDRCRTITHRLLGFAKRIEIKIETVNINDVVHEVLGFLEREAVYRRIDIRLKLMDSIKLISSDRGQLQQVFLNLLTNAFAAVDDGGIITLTTGNVKSGGVVITVSDNGSGIPADIIKHIFDPFFSTKKGSGTGLGLSITYGIIKKLGGSISVKSLVDKGTVFTVILPENQDTEMEIHDE